ncbi:hypothetical protein GM658_18640 [Pseudoduganella eburnea]|uniref:Uncharacterized protein n=2 Tax=Massilia eburnea TaxID=1776165 RepID=A0A6L6QKC4_9BURK|nr:hypothetical protein [Massilia eburnea]
MLEQHEQLVRVRDVQLQGAHAELARKAALRNGIRREVERAEAALRVLAAQRASWDRQWQAWIKQGGALQRGKAYADQHLKIAALENDLEQERASILERLQEAQQEVDAAQIRTRKQQHALSNIIDMVGQMKKMQRQEREAREVQRSEDAVAASWYLARKTLAPEARHE